MSIETNPYLPPLRGFFTRVVFDMAVLYRVAHALEDRKKDLTINVRDVAPNPRRLMAGTVLWIFDYTATPVNNRIELFFASDRESRGTQWLEHVDAMVMRESALALAQGYEAFETFVKDTVGVFFFRNPTAIVSRPWRKSGRQRAVRPPTGSVEAWKQLARQLYGRDFPDLMKRVRESSALFERAERQNVLRADLRAWFRAVTEVRHAATHSDGVVKKDRLAPLTPLERRHLGVYLGVGQATRELPLRISRELAVRTLRHIAGYGFQLFKAMSIAESLDWKHPQRPARGRKRP